MEVFVKDKDIPKSCGKCKFCVKCQRMNGYYCILLNSGTGYLKKEMVTKLEECPLKCIEDEIGDILGQSITKSLNRGYEAPSLDKELGFCEIGGFLEDEKKGE